MTEMWPTFELKMLIKCLFNQVKNVLSMLREKKLKLQVYKYISKKVKIYILTIILSCLENVKINIFK